MSIITGTQGGTLQDVFNVYGGFEQTPWDKIDPYIGGSQNRSAFAAAMRGGAPSAAPVGAPMASSWLSTALGAVFGGGGPKPTGTIPTFAPPSGSLPGGPTTGPGGLPTLGTLGTTLGQTLGQTLTGTLAGTLGTTIGGLLPGLLPKVPGLTPTSSPTTSGGGCGCNGNGRDPCTHQKMSSAPAPLASFFGGCCPPGRVLRRKPFARDICIKKPRMNPFNPQALARADRRVTSFARRSKAMLKDLGYHISPARKLKGPKRRKHHRRG